jgi:hypothetical protein
MESVIDKILWKLLNISNTYNCANNEINIGEFITQRRKRKSLFFHVEKYDLAVFYVKKQLTLYLYFLVMAWMWTLIIKLVLPSAMGVCCVLFSHLWKMEHERRIWFLQSESIGSFILPWIPKRWFCNLAYIYSLLNHFYYKTDINSML